MPQSAFAVLLGTLLAFFGNQPLELFWSAYIPMLLLLVRYNPRYRFICLLVIGLLWGNIAVNQQLSQRLHDSFDNRSLMLEALLRNLEGSRHIEYRPAVLNRDDTPVTEAATVSCDINVIDDWRGHITRAQKIRVQRVRFTTFNGVMRRRQRLTENLPTEHARTSNIATLTAEDSIFDLFELEQTQ